MTQTPLRCLSAVRDLPSPQCVRSSIAFLAMVLGSLGFAPDADAQRAYVLGIKTAGSVESQVVTVIDATTNTVVTTIPAGAGCTCLVDAERLALSPDASRLYVANKDSVSIVDLATNTVIDTISPGRSVDAVSISPNGARLYVATGWPYPPALLQVYNTATKALITSIPYSGGSTGMAISPDGSRIYLSSTDQGPTADLPRVKVFDATNNTYLTSIDVGPPAPYQSSTRGVYPLSLGVSPDGSRVYMSDFFSAKLVVINALNNTVVTTIESETQTASTLGTTARVSPDGSRVIHGTVLSTKIVNAQTNTLVTSIAGGAATVAYTPDGTRAYLASGIQVRILATATNAITGTIQLSSAVNGSAAAMVMSPPTRIMSLGSSALNFGGVRVGTAGSQTLTIGNSGNSPLIVSSIAFPAGFSSNWSSGVIPPGGSQAVSVFFSPAPKAYEGTITIDANETSGPTTVDVSGYGTIELNRGADFDGDRRSDLGVYRRSTGSWYVLKSAAGYTAGDGFVWGADADTPVAGDYDGDGRIDVAVYRPSSAHWFILRSGSGYTQSSTYQWGTLNDVPVPADFDGDGRTDIAVYRPSNGTWYILKSNTNYSAAAAYAWGAGADVPMAGDYDGDGRADVAVFRPSTAHWFVLKSSSGYTGFDTFQWGTTGDIPVPGDYDSDGKTDAAVYRPSNGTWYVLRSTSRFTQGIGYQWGAGADMPVPGDFDGDGTTDLAVYRPSSGHWFVMTSSSRYTSFIVYQWGTTGDVPLLKRP